MPCSYESQLASAAGSGRDAGCAASASSIAGGSVPVTVSTRASASIWAAWLSVIPVTANISNPARLTAALIQCQRCSVFSHHERRLAAVAPSARAVAGRAAAMASEVHVHRQPQAAAGLVGAAGVGPGKRAVVVVGQVLHEVLVEQVVDGGVEADLLVELVAAAQVELRVRLVVAQLVLRRAGTAVALAAVLAAHEQRQVGGGRPVQRRVEQVARGVGQRLAGVV